VKQGQQLKPDPGSLLAPEQAETQRRNWYIAGPMVLFCLVWLIACYNETLWSTIVIWRRSDTFAHGFLIFPISAYLIWVQRDRLRALKPRPNLLAILVLAVLGFIWLVAHLAGVNVVQQYAFVAMIPMLVWAILGSEIFSALLFPLTFLLLAVPVGDSLIPPLINFTADFTVTALRLTGIPVYREGSFFSIPSGNWSVVEACSGLRYLIASLTLGFLYAYLTYRSFLKRFLFVVVSAALPILANGVRAYMIVMIGHVFGMKYAVGTDHLLYGWVFFGLVMLLLFWAGSFWRDAEEKGFQSNGAPTAPVTPLRFYSLLSATALSFVTTLVWPVFAAVRGSGASFEETAIRFSLPQEVGTWRSSDLSIADWKPRYVGAKQDFYRTYAGPGGAVGVIVKFYQDQRNGSELINSENKIVSSDNKAWGNVGESFITVQVNNIEIPVRETQIRSAQQKAHQRLLVWDWNWIAGTNVTNSYLAKLLQAKGKLIGESDTAAAIFLYTYYEEQPSFAHQRLRDFASKLAPELLTRLYAVPAGVRTGVGRP
jgi:exosortase A